MPCYKGALIPCRNGAAGDVGPPSARVKQRYCHVHFHFGVKTENRSETDEAHGGQVISKLQLHCS